MLTLLSARTVLAQPAPLEVPKFRLITGFRWFKGGNSRGIQLQAIGGLNRGNCFAGIGGGVDYGHLRTIPVFLDLRHWFGRLNHQWFLHGDVGNVVSKATEVPEDESGDLYRFQGRGFFTFGAGCNIAMIAKHALSVSLEYSRLNLDEKRTRRSSLFAYTPSSSQNGYVYLSPEYFHFRMNRVSLKIDFIF